jgi:homoprotocatechuate degradation regulator HpaR
MTRNRDSHCLNRKRPGLRHRNLPMLMLQGRERLIAYFRPLLKDHGVTEQQWRIVRVLLDASPLEPRQIGEACGISSPSLVGVLERMEQDGLIARCRVAHDQRRIHVSLTAKSRRLAEQLAPAVTKMYEGIEARLGSELWARVHQTLDDLIAALPLEGNAQSPQSMPGDIRLAHQPNRMRRP